MKKIFLATTAIAALSVAGAANAAEWSAGVGGYMQIGVGFNGDSNKDGVGILRDGEIHLNAKMVADNGLTFDARVELEAVSDSDQIDENWARVSGSFGSVKVGGDDSAKNSYNNGVIYSPGARVGYYDAYTQNISNTGGTEQGGISGAGDHIGIHYDSPNWMGFRFGATYIPNRNTDGGSDNHLPVYGNDNDGDDYWAIGAAYSGSFNDVGIGISGGIDDSNNNDNTWHVAGNVSFSGFTIAGGYEDNGGTSDDMYIGARYSTGPWTIAGGYSVVDYGSDCSSCSDAEVFAAWVTYAVAPGVTANVGIESEDSDSTDDVSGLLWMTMGF